MKSIGVIVVHGVGEQTRFEHLEAVASNLYRALRYGKNSRKHPQIQLNRGDQVARNSDEESWREAPATVSWQDESGEDIELRFREVRWADLDMPMTWSRWFKLVGWCLGISGVQLYDGSSNDSSMNAAGAKDGSGRFWIRAQLFGVSLLFFLLLITVDLIYGVVTRFGFAAKWLGSVRGLIYNYLGDVKLYQDWFVRSDDRLETLGEKSRVAIRRRMIRTLAQSANDVENGEIDGYYLFAHSLGTVVAFNGLMEPDLALPNYFTREEWNGEMCSGLKFEAENRAPNKQMPKRPAWLEPKDAISRAKLFGGFRGFLTMGSPLDKFAALWPAIVPVNSEPVPGEKRWVNVADVQDIVAGSIDDYPGCDEGVVGGLKLSNINWPGEWTLFSAHTSYWKAKRNSMRLIDRLIPWLEGGELEKPEPQLSSCFAKALFWTSLGLLGLLLLWLAASTIWLFSKSGEMVEFAIQKAAGLDQTVGRCFWEIICDCSYLSSTLIWSVCILGTVVGIILLFSVVRGIWERAKFR